jgi:hypothetical protein
MTRETGNNGNDKNMIFIALPEEKIQCSRVRFESPEFLL